jgi:hypothetical protein
MQAASKGPNIDKSALLILDMQNDFLHREGSFSNRYPRVTFRPPKPRRVRRPGVA